MFDKITNITNQELSDFFFGQPLPQADGLSTAAKIKLWFDWFLSLDTAFGWALKAVAVMMIICVIAKLFEGISRLARRR